MDIDGIEFLTEREKKVGALLLANGTVSEDQFREFLAKREKIDTSGKSYLGRMLIAEGHISQETLDEFFMANNRIYLDLLGKMEEGGYISKGQYAEVMRDPVSKSNVVASLENLKIMTKESFIRLCSNRAHLLMLGEWLLMNGRIQRETLDRALEEQHVNNLEDYLAHRGLVSRAAMAELIDKLNLH